MKEYIVTAQNIIGNNPVTVCYKYTDESHAYICIEKLKEVAHMSDIKLYEATEINIS